MEVKAHNRNLGKAGAASGADQATKAIGLKQPSGGQNIASGNAAVGVNVSGKATVRRFWRPDTTFPISLGRMCIMHSRGKPS